MSYYCTKRTMEDFGFPIHTARGPRILPTSARCPDGLGYTAPEVTPETRNRLVVFGAFIAVVVAAGVGFGLVAGRGV